MQITKEKIFDLITTNLMKLMFDKKDFDIENLLKKMKFKLKKEFKKNNSHVAIGNEGNVFDSVILGKNNKGEKIVVLYSNKREEPYFILLDSTKNEELEIFIENLNKNIFEYKGKDVSSELKNRTLQQSFIAQCIDEILNK